MKPKTIPPRLVSFVVLDLLGKSPGVLVEGTFRNAFKTLEEAIEHAASQVEKRSAKCTRLHVVQIMHIATKSKGSHQAKGVQDEPAS